MILPVKEKRIEERKNKRRKIKIKATLMSIILMVMKKQVVTMK
jgi:hypothetical protein